VVLTGLDSLAASERRIAELASQDLTNREIAQTLFITDRTVEGHLRASRRDGGGLSSFSIRPSWRRRLPHHALRRRVQAAWE
jgi:FixJ family two-component response regulator